MVQLFTDNEKDSVDVTLSLAVIPLFSFTNMVDMCLSFFMGIVRALGIQANVAVISISCFYLVSLPVASYLAFVADAGIGGLWMGYFLGIIVQVLILAWMTWDADWQEIADEAEERLKQVFEETVSIVPDRLTDLDYLSLFGVGDGEDEEREALIARDDLSVFKQPIFSPTRRIRTRKSSKPKTNGTHRRRLNTRS